MKSVSAVSTAESPLATDRSSVSIGRYTHVGISLAAGLTAGVLAFAALVALFRFGLFFEVPQEVLVVEARQRLSAEEFEFVHQARRLQAYQNTALTVAIFGAVVAGLLGMAAGAARKSVWASSSGLFGGTLVGAGAGALGGLADLYLLEWLWPMEFDHSYKAMIGHTAAFLTAGIGIGAVAGIAARQVPQTLGVVLAAALIAGLIYPGIAAALFPVLNTDAAVPEGTLALLLWMILPAGLMGLAVGRMPPRLLPGPVLRRS